MPRGTSLGLKTVQWLIRSVQLLCAVIILGIYSYFLAALSNHNLATPTNVRAVEGIVGIAVAYALLGLLLLCCLAGRTLTAFVAMCIDFALLSAYIFVAVANKGGAGSCSGDEVSTVFGKGKADDTLNAGGGFTKIPSYRTACKLETACLAIAIIAIFFYIFSILVELALGRHHQREKRLANSPPQMQMPYAENPYNNYQPAMGGAYEPESQQSRPTGFLGRVFGGRRSRGQQAVPQHDDPNNLPAHAQPIDMANSNNRDSEATAVGHEQQPPYNNPIEAPATYTYTQAGNPYTHATGDSYTHAGDHYGHAGDDYYQQHHRNAGAHNANTTSTLPYPADNPYDSPHEPHRTEPPSHLTMPPRYPAQSHHYDDGIYDRP
ncbi:hypothetical protein LMH87_004433 [Akanthomyces muscarius]|uniref:MARVEL domain-containing protein n=1 Tax=Akanthomyces muscarius TaxID=2231603 RepID=A0A9W8Q581_AKAMU|nr:hypothetical protein LMH87_004433 [Akanthomyces muscarius]KAJ4145586.1 hypothetical protein LMH87_004433 [Akanthomyces muscarius]